MPLNDFNFKPDYNKAFDNIADEFYLPCMKSSCLYQRISGYFGSTIYILAWDALKEFINNSGKIKIICSPNLSPNDLEAIKEGNEAKSDDVIKKVLDDEVNELFESDYLIKPARILACLIANGVIEIKFAVPGDEISGEIRRLFHDKVGLFFDDKGNAVGFRGPMNETYNGLSSDGNLESIDVFPSWENERERTRLEHAKEYFNLLWNKNVENVMIFDIPKAIENNLFEKSKGYDWEKILDEISIEKQLEEKWKPNKSKNAKTPRLHQIQALENWVKNGRRGIFEHATGSGKTFTAICAIKDGLNHNNIILILVPSTDLLKQWKLELDNNLFDDSIKYLLCGDDNNQWKKEGFLERWTDNFLTTRRIIIATMDTACSFDFIDRIKPNSKLFIIADEVHRLGSTKRKNVFKIETGPRLGLSATPIRYGDPEGTKAIFDYFDGVLEPKFTLQDAIKAKVLTPYFYKILTVELEKDEQQRWNDLSKRINTLIAIQHGNNIPIKEILNDQQIKQLLIKRARIVKTAIRKIELAVKTIKENFKDGQKWIIYCDNKDQLSDVLRRLLEEKIDAYEYHSDMLGDRQQTLDYFKIHGGVLVSIRCLDEGVDIPSTTHALILASSKNPREFIQRRGRILRKAEGKTLAYLYDAIVIPSENMVETKETNSIIAAELKRAIEFGGWAKNNSCITEIKLIALKYGIDLDNLMDGEVEDEE